MENNSWPKENIYAGSYVNGKKDGHGVLKKRDGSIYTGEWRYDMMHGKGNLDKAIQLLPKKDKEDFKDFVNSEVSFNPHNMFICKNKKILFTYYESLFPWLADCEKIFGFEKLQNYGLKRIYGFLAERYLSYWFKKYTKFTVLPIHFKDIGDYLL